MNSMIIKSIQLFIVMFVLSGCAHKGDGFGASRPGAARVASIAVHMTRDRAQHTVPTKVRVSRAKTVSEVQPALVPDAPAATPAAPENTTTVKPVKKHGKIWRFFHRKPKQGN
jgi:hypothetical protein